MMPRELVSRLLCENGPSSATAPHGLVQACMDTSTSWKVICELEQFWFEWLCRQTCSWLLPRLLLRLAGHEQPFEGHPVPAPFFKVDALRDRAWRNLKRFVPVNWPRKLGRRKHATMHPFFHRTLGCGAKPQVRALLHALQSVCVAPSADSEETMVRFGLHDLTTKFL